MGVDVYDQGGAAETQSTYILVIKRRRKRGTHLSPVQLADSGVNDPLRADSLAHAEC